MVFVMLGGIFSTGAHVFWINCRVSAPILVDLICHKDDLNFVLFRIKLRLDADSRLL